MPMSNLFPIWWNNTLTVYHRMNIGNEVTWIRNVVDDCFWTTSYQDRYNNEKSTSPTIIVRIPKQLNYVPASEFDKLPYEQKSKFFTVNIGDIIVNSVVNDVINEYTSGERSSDLITKYKDIGCVTIQSLVIDTGFGRGLQHYNIRGI